MKAYDIFKKYADIAEWNGDSKVRVLTDFIDHLYAENPSIQTAMAGYFSERSQEGRLLTPELRESQLAKRGVEFRYVSKNVRIEQVCGCICHNRPGVRHIRACCHSPTTERGRKSLEGYKK